MPGNLLICDLRARKKELQACLPMYGYPRKQEKSTKKIIFP